MKKYLKGILATTMVLSMTAALAGCGGSGETATTDDTAAEGGEAKETLVLATSADFPPYEYYEGQEIVGIDAEIVRRERCSRAVSTES